MIKKHVENILRYPCNKTQDAPVQGCKTPWRQVARVTNIRAVDSNISGFTLCNFCMPSIGRHSR
jgi:hypothetical protein